MEGYLMATGKEFIHYKLIIAKLMGMYHHSQSIIEKAEIEELYKNLLHNKCKFEHVILTDDEKTTIKIIDLIIKMYEQYHTDHNIVRKAQITQLFLRLKEII
jgi:hypothetical protein